MRNRLLFPAFAAAALLGACKKTGDNTYEIQRPVIGTRTDTVKTPSVDVVQTRDTINTPQVTTKKTEISVPKVRVRTP